MEFWTTPIGLTNQKLRIIPWDTCCWAFLLFYFPLLWTIEREVAWFTPTVLITFLVLEKLNIPQVSQVLCRMIWVFADSTWFDKSIRLKYPDISFPWNVLTSMTLISDISLWNRLIDKKWKPMYVFFLKGWLPRAKLKKIQEGIVGFGCNFGGMIAHLYRSHSPGYTQIRQG